MKEKVYCRLEENKNPRHTWFQIIYEQNDKEISLIHTGFLFETDYCWEIYCLKGDLFDDVIRFKTIEEAIKRIKKELLVARLNEIKVLRNQKISGNPLG